MKNYQRKSIRLPKYDYSSHGAYFITVCIENKKCLLGQVINDSVILSDFGNIASNAWIWLAVKYSHVSLDAWVVMPNHIHGILWLSENDCESKTLIKADERKPLGRIVAAFKTVSTNKASKLNLFSLDRIWQRNYYEHVIRDDNDLNRIRDYILNNPKNWSQDMENPEYR